MLRDPRRLQLSLADAFLNDDVDVEGDLEAIFPLADFLLKERHWGPREQLWAARAVRALPNADGSQNGRARPRLRGARDSADRLAQAVEYHYNLDPEFYGLFLDPRLRLHVCVLRGPRRGHRLGAGAEARLRLPEAPAGAGRTAARHRLWLGRARDARGRAVRGRGSRRDAQPPAGASSRTSASAPRGLTTAAGSKCATTASVERASSTRSQASACSSTSASKGSPNTSSVCSRCSGRAEPSSTTESASGTARCAAAAVPSS